MEDFLDDVDDLKSDTARLELQINAFKDRLNAEDNS
jgi:ubiquinone biosynthesis protein UbiJ